MPMQWLSSPQVTPCLCRSVWNLRFPQRLVKGELGIAQGGMGPWSAWTGVQHEDAGSWVVFLGGGYSLGVSFVLRMVD